MKRISSLVFVSLFLILFAGSIFGQTAFTENMLKDKTAGYVTYYTAAAVDSTGDTLTTANISLDDGIETIPVYQYKTFSSAAAKPKIKLVRQEYRLGTWTDVKTYYTSDSTETNYVSMGLDTLRATNSRFLIMGAAGNRADAQIKMIQRFKRLGN